MLIISNLLDASEVSAYREALERAQWQDGLATAGSLSQSVKQNEQVASQCELGQALADRLRQRLSQHPLFISAALPQSILRPRFNRYRNNGHYGLHIDSAIMASEDGRGLFRSDLSATLFLSDPNSYSGGELSIDSGFGVQEVKLPAGSLVLYATSRWHQVEPVTVGERIAAICWVQSLVASDAQRELLFDLDQSIQRLQQLPEARAEHRQLTGVYNNLLRQWAIT